MRTQRQTPAPVLLHGRMQRRKEHRYNAFSDAEIVEWGLAGHSAIRLHLDLSAIQDQVRAHVRPQGLPLANVARDDVAFCEQAMLTKSTHPFWCSPGTRRILAQHDGSGVDDFYSSQAKRHETEISSSHQPVVAIDKAYTEVATIIEDTMITAAKKPNCCNTRVTFSIGRGKKLRQTCKDGSSARQKVGSPQMKYKALLIGDPTETSAQLNQRGFWEVTRDAATDDFKRRDLVHEASNAWGNYTPDVIACPMPAQLVISRGTERADSTQVDTTWSRQWAKQS